MTHESHSELHAAKPGSPRSFGLVFATVFGLVGLWPVLHGAPIRLWALVIALGFAAAAVVRPNVFAQANALWFRLGLLLGRIITPVVMSLVFFVGVVPTAFVMRLVGKDPLRLKRAPNASTYWIPRQPSDRPSSMRNQF